MREHHSRYSTVSIVLHWTIAILIIANATFGGWMEDAADSEKLGYYQLHKSVGITILALSLIRLGWRFGHPWPAFPGGMPAWERLLARTTHVLPAPNLPLPLNDNLADELGDLHKLMVKAIYVVLALHVLGALKHHFFDKDEVLHRMLPLFRNPRG